MRLRKRTGRLLLASAFSLCLLASPCKAGQPLSGVVFLDRNGNGVRDEGEPGVAAARISDQAQTVVSGADGKWSIAESVGTGIVAVSAPPGYRPAGAFWKKAARIRGLGAVGRNSDSLSRRERGGVRGALPTLPR